MEKACNNSGESIAMIGANGLNDLPQEVLELESMLEFKRRLDKSSVYEDKSSRAKLGRIRLLLLPL